MPRTVPLQKQRTSMSVEDQLALAECVLRGASQSIDEQVQRAQDLEVERALLLYKSGKASLQDSKSVFDLARRLA